MELFRVRLNCVDHYQAVPTPYDPQLRSGVAPSQRHDEPKVPVIRVFGATETGQKVCAHIHGAFPYLYVEYNEALEEDVVGTYIHQLHLSIDHALAVSYRRNIYDEKNKFVARITLVKGTPFYGFHVGYRYYLKIYMLNPMVMTRLADLLRQGVVMKRTFQPFEAHLQYLLQWMTDYNLYGCGFIDTSKAYFRAPVPIYDELENPAHLWHDRSIPPSFLLGEGVLPRVSHCSIEVDLCVQDILNRHDIKPRPLHHDFLERQNPFTQEEKLVFSMAGLWKDETRRRKSRMINPDPGSSPFPPEVMVSMSADPRASQDGGWIHEEEYRDMITDLIADEKHESDSPELSFDTYARQHTSHMSAKTVFESVEDLYPQNLAPALGLKYEATQRATTKSSSSDNVEVDEQRLLDMADTAETFMYESDEDVMRELGLPQLKTKNGIPKQAAPGSNKKLRKVEFEQKLDFSDTELMEMIDHSSPSLDNDSEVPAPGVDMLLVSDQKVHSRRDSATNVPQSSTDSLGKRDHQVNKRARGTAELESPRKHVKIAGSVKTDRNSTGQKIQAEYTNNQSTADTNEQPYLDVNTSLCRSTSTNRKSPTKIRASQEVRSSQESIKASSGLFPNTIGFPVVKKSNVHSGIPRSSKEPGQKVLQSPPPQATPGSLVLSQGKSRSSESLSPRPSYELLDIHAGRKLLDVIFTEFPTIPGSTAMIIQSLAPPTLEVSTTMQAYNLWPVIYQDAYYSNEEDVPDRMREYAGREFKLESLTVPFLPHFDPTGTSLATYGEKQGIVLDRVKEDALLQRRRHASKLQSWEIGVAPPSTAEVIDWVKLEAQQVQTSATLLQPTVRPIEGMRTRLSQVDGPTQKNRHGFKYSQKHKTTSVQHETDYMSTMSLEVHVNTRGTLVPNPEEDEVQSVFWCLQSDNHELESNGMLEGTYVGIVVLSEDGLRAKQIARQTHVEVREEVSELDLMLRMVEIVRTYDPDILTGYEVHGSSWGYLIERARLKYDYNLCDEFSRMKSQSHGRFGKENDKWGFNNTSTIRVTGRHMINIWRAMRSELNLLQYTMENVVFHVLHRRIPHYAWRDLTTWYTNGKLGDLAKVLHYYISRVQTDLEILEQNELIPRTSEQARLLGVDFFSVFSRGSQFKVESLMFRIAKPENFLLVSPSRKQVGGQNALECLPLVMEPQSAFYNSPLLVLDFQSLYPSVMIAYNYCYSTFLGRIVNWRGTNKMGFTEYRRQQRLLELLKDHVNIAPNGMMYVKPKIRKSLLAKMLGEILETRVMVKSGMKVDKDDKTLQRLLNNRQLALKLIANVTYGYTSASFSGRMPCSEIADSIVQTGRESLEKAIALIHSVKRWGAEVVYGDTDSLFVYLKGRTKDQAFDIGNEIAKTITNMNPRPVKLKFEKVYFPCVLLAKKRYVGFKYESKDQKEPEFDAKGIETVRRDGTPAEQKIEEKALKLLFRSADLSQVKHYFQEQCEKIMKGEVSIQDFCFAKEVKLGTYSENGIPPPGALISTKRMLADHRAEPQYGERIPYVVITGAPGARLIDRCVAPETLLHSNHNDLDAEYYISKNLIPPLERIFNLVGANVRNWYDEMPKIQRVRRVKANAKLLDETTTLPIAKRTLESYMKSSSCIVCNDKLESEGFLCARCLSNPSLSLLKLHNRMSKLERTVQDVERVCKSCSGFTWSDEVKCDSKDCPVFYTRTKQMSRLITERTLAEPVFGLLEATSGSIGEQVLEW